MNIFDPSLLASLPQFELLSAQPLSGGLSNRCWVLELKERQTAEQRKAVWRPQAESTTAFGLSRQQEHRILKQLQHLPIAPDSLALLEQGLLVEWVEGVTADKTLSDQALLRLQAELHSLPVPDWRLDVKSKAEHYWGNIPQQYKSPQLEEIYRHFQRQMPVAWFGDTCCHHDLGRYNIICQPDGSTRVIDWEYAAAGDPSFDLALTINANALEPLSAVKTYCKMRGDSDWKRWYRAVLTWQPWCDYLAMLWYFVGAGLWHDNTYKDEALLLQKKLTAIIN